MRTAHFSDCLSAWGGGGVSATLARQTDACENITLPQTSFVCGNQTTLNILAWSVAKICSDVPQHCKGPFTPSIGVNAVTTLQWC